MPSNIILPFVGIEFDNSRAQRGPALMPFAALLIGQKTSSGTVTAKTLTPVFSTAEVGQKAGIGSQLHVMAKAWFKNNSFTDTYIIALDDEATGTLATRTITFTGTATEDGEIPIYINGVRVAVSVAKDDTATVIGDTLVTAMSDYDYLPWSAANVTGTVTMTCKNDGVAAGDNDMRHSIEPTEKIPGGITVTIGTTTAGTVDPDVQDALDAIGDQWFQVIVNPYDDATNLGKIEDYLKTTFGVMYQKDSVCYQAKRDTVSNLVTFATGAGRNSPHCVLIDAGNRLGATYEIASAVAAQSAASAQDDPAVPLHRLELIGYRPNVKSERRTFTERNNLARNGVMTLSDENGLQTESTVTMYLKNSAGAVDTSYQYQNTMFVLQRARYRAVQRFLSKYPRAKLVDDTTRLQAGQQAISPDIAKMELIAYFKQEEREGQFENIDQFIEDLVVERDATNTNRLNFIMSPDLVNQFIVGSGIIQFLL